MHGIHAYVVSYLGKGGDEEEGGGGEELHGCFERWLLLLR
jgi:hypothetical protein